MIDNSFTIKTSDPARAFDPTASMVDRALYDTLFTYKGDNLATPIPLLVSSWKASSNAKTFTFQLKQQRPLRRRDAADLGGCRLVAEAPRQPEGEPVVPARGRDRLRRPASTRVVMRSKTPDTELPVILANPSTGILNSALVIKNGGSDAANAAKADTAENWLNSSASAGAGSGPYTLSSYSTTSQISLVPSTNYWGAKKSPWSSVVVRNMIATTQLLNVARGSHEIAIDLSADQAQTLKGNKNVNVSLQPSTWIFFLMANNNAEGLAGDLEREVPDRASVRARLLGARHPRRAGRDPGTGSHPVDVPRRAPAERQDQAGSRQGQGGARRVRRGEPAGDAPVPERPDDQRRAVHLDGPEGPVEPAGCRASTSRSRAPRPPTG